MDKNKKTPKAKKHNKLVELWKWKRIRILTLFTVGLLTLIPLLFCWIFRGDEHSVGLGFIHSHLSVSDWVSFWATLVAGLASTFVAALALLLSLTIERRSLEEKRSNEKLLFYPTNVVLKATKASDSYMFVIYLPQKMMFLEGKSCKVIDAIYNGTRLSMQIECHLNDWQPHIILQCDEDKLSLDDFKKLVSEWKDKSWFHDNEEYKFRIKLRFQYNALDYRDINQTYFVCVILNLGCEKGNSVSINPTVGFVTEDSFVIREV